MKNLKTFLLSLFLASMTLPFAFGQNSQRMFIIHEDRVMPGMMDEYMQLLGEAAAAFEARGNKMESHAFVREDFSVIHVTPIESMADLDRDMGAYFSEMMGEEAFRRIMTKFDNYYHQHGDYVVALNEELSYMPEGDIDITTPGNPYRLWMYYTVSANDYDMAVNLAKEMKALHKKAGSKLYWRIYEPVLGIMGPQFVVVMSGKDAGELESRMVATEKLLKGENKKILNKVLDMTIDYKTLRGERVDLGMGMEK